MAIILTKGQKINLKKESGESLSKFCVGVNWGAIETRKAGLFGSRKIIEDVDLDLSCIMTDEQGRLTDYIYSPEYNGFLKRNNLPAGKLVTKDGAMKHTGDDRQGDRNGDDGLDNEIITVDLELVDQAVKKIFFFVNIYLNEGQAFDFSQIPYARIRMYEGSPVRVVNQYASFDIATDNTFSGKRAIVLGSLYRKEEEWKFNAIGEPTNDQMFLDTIQTILKKHAL